MHPRTPGFAHRPGTLTYAVASDVGLRPCPPGTG